jgi:hypothetical protein
MAFAIHLQMTGLGSGYATWRTESTSAAEEAWLLALANGLLLQPLLAVDRM